MKKYIFYAVILLILMVNWSCSPHFHLDLTGSDQMKEVTLIESTSPNKILVIDIRGAIFTQVQTGLFDREGDLVSKVYTRLRKAAKDPRVKGIILRLDTPGGEVTASDIIYNEIRRFKEESGLPVTALMMSVAASGGYYIACACDSMMAHPTTITGSIGVITIFPEFQGLMGRLGIKVNTVKSGKMKDAGSPMRTMKDEERAYFQNMVNQMQKNFLEVVHQNRKDKIPMAELEKLADGRIYNAQQALKNKLIDHIGYFHDALEQVKRKASINDASVVAYTFFPKRKTNLYATASTQGNPLSLEIKGLPNLLPTLKAGFYYLWMPEL